MKDFGHRADLFNFAVIQDSRSFAQEKRFSKIVGDHQEGGSCFLMEFFQDVPNLFAEIGVQGREGFIQKQNGRIYGQGSCKGYPLFLTAAQMANRTVSKRLESETLHEPLYPFPGGLPVGFVVPQSEGNVCKNRQVGKQGIVLIEYPDAPFFRRQVCNVPIIHTYAAARDGNNTGHGFQYQGLARSCRTEKREKLPGLN